MDKKESFATKCGRWLGTLFTGCVAACLSAILIALTVRFIMWLM
jgi:hypothetical protein